MKPGASHPSATPPGWSACRVSLDHVCFANRVRRDELVTLGFLDSLAQRFVSFLILFIFSFLGGATLTPLPPSVLCIAHTLLAVAVCSALLS